MTKKSSKLSMKAIKDLKILHLSYYDKTGGAAIAALRHNNAMLESGIDSKLMVLHKSSKESSVVEIDSKIRRFLFKLSHHWEYLRMKKVVDRYSVSLSDLSAFDLSSEFIQEADVIYIHWVNMAFLSIKDVKKLLDLNKLVVCYMHDMWPITGICHYSFDCNQYMSRCVNCNQIKSSNYATKYLISRKNYLAETQI